MNVRRHNGGFSLTEVLLALGTMAVGMVLAAGLFPAGVLFTNTAVERTIAVVAADEAFAKIRLIARDSAAPILASDFSADMMLPFEGVAKSVPPNIYLYPSANAADSTPRAYCWSAICRRTSDSDVQVTVFVCRRIQENNRPLPEKIAVSGRADPNSIQVTDPVKATYIGEGQMVVHDSDGQIYRVVSRNDPIIMLDRAWEGPNGNSNVWVVPPPTTLGGGRYPCIGVYQKVIRF
jgi:Tfp pilus assembly protein PilV